MVIREDDNENLVAWNKEIVNLHKDFFHGRHCQSNRATRLRPMCVRNCQKKSQF